MQERHLRDARDEIASMIAFCAPRPAFSFLRPSTRFRYGAMKITPESAYA